MNALILIYLKRFHPEKAVRLAVNKIDTKEFLSQRWIPVPQTYDEIRSRQELYEYDFSTVAAAKGDGFMLKPVKGSRGRGIYRVKLIDDPNITFEAPEASMLESMFMRHSPYADQLYQVGDKILNDTTLRRYLVDTLDGKNSINPIDGDTIMLEEILVPGSGFEQYCKYGLADIRVIVFNLIPIAAMLRVPTEQSDGKANLDRGGLGMWVEVATGKIYAMYQNGKIYKKKFPAQYAQFQNQYLSYWDDILSYSSKIQYFANLGYLALDRVITEDGPKLLEINARAGLKFQIASMLPIRNRLDKIADLKVTTPEKGVEIAQSLFTEQKAQVVNASKIVYLSQHGRLKIKWTEKTIATDVIVEVDLKKKRNYVSKHLMKRMTELKMSSTQLELTTQGIRLDWLERRPLEGNEKNKIVLGSEAVADFYVKPINKIKTSFQIIAPGRLQKSEVDQLHILDEKLDRLSKILNTSHILKPVNFLEQLDLFITNQGNYNPIFKYRRPADAKLDEVKDQLDRLEEKYFWHNGLQSDFAKLFAEKIAELRKKVSLITAYKYQRMDDILAANKAIYGDLDADLLAASQEKIFAATPNNRKDLWPVLSLWEIRECVLNYLKKKGFKWVKVDFDSDGFGRMTVIRGKSISIRISNKAWFREKELLATLAHEIDVHVTRYLAWVKSGWSLLKNWTADYIKDDEGLAIMASEWVLPDEYEKRGMYQKYWLLGQAANRNFAQLAMMASTLTTKSMIGVFKWVLRVKKWIIDTSIINPWAIHYKDKIYLDGYMKMQKRIADGGDKEDLMIGKIKTQDLKFIK